MNGFAERKWNSESRMRENRPSGLMRGGEQTVIGPRVSQSVASRPLYLFTSLDHMIREIDANEVAGEVGQGA